MFWVFIEGSLSADPELSTSWASSHYLSQTSTGGRYDNPILQTKKGGIGRGSPPPFTSKRVETRFKSSRAQGPKLWDQLVRYKGLPSFSPLMRFTQQLFFSINLTNIHNMPVRCQLYVFWPGLKVLLCSNPKSLKSPLFATWFNCSNHSCLLPSSVWHQRFYSIAFLSLSLSLMHLLTWHSLTVSIMHKIPSSRTAWSWPPLSWTPHLFECGPHLHQRFQLRCRWQCC